MNQWLGLRLAKISGTLQPRQTNYRQGLCFLLHFIYQGDVPVKGQCALLPVNMSLHTPLTFGNTAAGSQMKWHAFIKYKNLKNLFITYIYATFISCCVNN